MNGKRIRLFTLIGIDLALSCLFVNIGKAGNDVWTTSGPYGIRPRHLVIDWSNPQIVYCTTETLGGVFKSQDGGQTWDFKQVIGQEVIPRDITDLAMNSDNSNVLYAAHQTGVYKSVDAGETWEKKGTFEGDTNNWPRIAVSPIDGDTVFFGRFSEFGMHLFKSEDGGGSWRSIPFDYNTMAIAIAPSAPHVMYIGTDGAGAWRSTDGGETWESITQAFAGSITVESLGVDPNHANTVYMVLRYMGLFRTEDGGGTWNPIGSGLPGGGSGIRRILVYPNNQQVLYAAGSGVYRSLTAEGQFWEPMLGGMGSRDVWSLVIDQSTPMNLYAGTDSGIWKYTIVSGVQDYSISLNDGALFTNQTAVTLSLTAPAGTTEMIISNDGGFGGAIWEPFATQKPWAVTAYGSYVIPRVVYAKFKTYGQISGLYQDDIVLDVTVPTGTVEITGTIGSVMVAGSSQHPMSVLSALTDTLTNTVYLPLVAGNARPGFTLVGLLLSATDDVSGVGEMLISNDASLADAWWEAYTTRKNWWVPDTGITTVYVKFRDRAGNESLVYFDTVTP